MHPATLHDIGVITKLYFAILRHLRKKVKENICYNAPKYRHWHRTDRGAQVHGAHQAASLIPSLDLPSRSRYSFTDPERMESWVSPGPGCKEQLANGLYATALCQLDSNLRPRGRWSSTLTTRLSRHPEYRSIPRREQIKQLQRLDSGARRGGIAAEWRPNPGSVQSPGSSRIRYD